MSRKRHHFSAALLLVLAGAAQAAQPGTACATCSASGIDPVALRAATRFVERDSAPLSARPAATASRFDALSAADKWPQRLGETRSGEAFNCALSFGVGGTLGSNSSIAARALGQSQLVREPGQ